jgi:hypothetical protein
MNEIRASFNFLTTEIQTRLGRIAQATTPSSAFIQIEKDSLVIHFTVRELRIFARVPISAGTAFLGNRCFMISSELLFSYFLIDEATITVRYVTSELGLGAATELEISTDFGEEVVWPGTSAELLSYPELQDGRPCKPEKLARAIELVGHFVDRKSENGLKSDILVMEPSCVSGQRTNSMLRLDHEAMQPFTFFVDRTAALALRATLRTLIPGKSFCWNDDRSTYRIGDERLCCEFHATPTRASPKQVFGPTLTVVGEQLNLAATAAIAQGGRGGAKSISITFEREDQDHFMVLAVQVPGASISDEGLARAKCKITAVDLDFDFEAETIVLTDPQITKAGLPAGSLEMCIKDFIVLSGSTDDEKITAAFARRRLTSSKRPR